MPDDPGEYRHVGSFAPHGHDGMGWLGNTEIYVKVEDYDNHVNYSADAFAVYADNARLRAALVRARAEIDRWGYGDHHYGNTPRDPGVLAALADIDHTLTTPDYSGRSGGPNE